MTICMRKYKKSKSVTEIKKSTAYKRAVLVVNSMAYTRKMPAKKIKRKTYGDVVKHLKNTFSKLASNHAKIAIIFDLYIIQYQINRTKQTKQYRKNKHIIFSLFSAPL